MKTANLLICTACFVVLVGPAAEYCMAQGFRGGMRRMGAENSSVSEMDLLTIDKVIKHLEKDYALDAEKKELIVKLAKETQEEISDERRAILEGIRDMSDSEREEVMVEFRETSEDINKDAVKQARKLLSKKQLRRLNELKFQRMGIAVLQDQTFHDILGITKEQAEKIKAEETKLTELREKTMSEIREAMGDGDRETMREMFSEMRETMTQMQEKMEKATMALLTKEQTDAFAKMKGDAFEFPERQRRRGGSRQ